MPRSVDEISDELLVIGCQRKDPRAWEQLVEKYGQRLTYFVFRLVADEDRGRQLVQEAWLAIFRGLPSLRRSDRLVPWLYTIVRRTVVSEWRTRKDLREEPLGSDGAGHEPVDDLSGPERSAENAELVHFWLAQIGVAEREVLTLFFLEEMSIEEVAGVLQIPSGTVKSRLARARRELRQIVEQQLGDEGLRGPSP